MPRKPNPDGGEGISPRHRTACTSRDGGACDCSPSYEVSVYVRREGRRVRKTFRSLAEAKRYRNKLAHARDEGRLNAPSALTLSEAAQRWLTQAESGAIRNRSGDRYKPSALRGYRRSLQDRILPELGTYKLSDIARSDLQRLVSRWQAAALDASTIRNIIVAVRAVYRDADLLGAGEVANPTRGLRLPAVRGSRDRIASVAEADALLAALPEDERPLWACAFYAGLRHGELKALRWEDIDLAKHTIHVRRGWDQHEGEIQPKSRSGQRTVAIITRLQRLLAGYRLRTGRHTGLVFGRDSHRPFCSSTINNRAQRAWTHAKLAPIGLHEARHTFASYLIAAGANPKAISEVMGHAGISITLDRYGHLLPGSIEEMATRLDAFLNNQSKQATGATEAHD